MHSDLTARAQRAYASIIVPDPPLAAIRARVERGDRQRRATLALACSAMLALAVAAGTGAGAAVTSQIRIWLGGGHAGVDVHGLTMTRFPTHADLADVVQRATFPVVLPVGVPAGARLQRILSSPSDHPTLITLDYRLPGGGGIGITLIDPHSVEGGTPPATSLRSRATPWTVSSETVLVTATASGFVRGMIAEMRAATPQSSLAASGSTTLGGIALDAHQLAQIPRLASTGAPLPDNRTVVMTNIPRVHGAPDYQHATLSWPQRVALAPDAVREVAAYLRVHPPAHAPLVYVTEAPPGTRVRALR